MFQPEMIVEMPVEQGSVHIQQNGVYIVPVYPHEEIREQYRMTCQCEFIGEPVTLPMPRNTVVSVIP